MAVVKLNNKQKIQISKTADYGFLYMPTFWFLWLNVHCLGLAAQELTGAINPHVHHLELVLGLLQAHKMLIHSMVGLCGVLTAAGHLVMQYT